MASVYHRSTAKINRDRKILQEAATFFGLQQTIITQGTALSPLVANPPSQKKKIETGERYMRGKQSFKQIAAFLLALCMTLEMLPISVVAAELDQTQEQHEEETVQPSSPSLSAGDIKTDENGKVTVVKCGDGMSQADALQLLFSGSDLSQTTPGKNAGLESSGLPEDVYESASELHGNETALNRELAELFSERERDGLDETAYENIKLLICSGYSYRQARAAIVSANVLDCTVEELCKAKIEEISEHRYSDASVETDEMVEEDGPAAEEFSAIDSIAIKMGIPSKLLASKMEQQAALSADSALDQFQSLMDSQYQYLPTDSSVAPPTEAASASDADAPAISYHPDKPLSNPFDYKQNGKLKVNMADGSYIFSETDLSIPGINGLDLNIVRQFDSKFANVTDPYGETTGRHKNEKTLKVSFDAYVSYDFTSSANDSDYQYVADFTQYTIWDQATNSSVHSTKPTFYTYDYGSQSSRDSGTRPVRPIWDPPQYAFWRRSVPAQRAGSSSPHGPSRFEPLPHTHRSLSESTEKTQ